MVYQKVSRGCNTFDVTDSDKRIGKNLAALRGARSQASVAADMRADGWKWSQPTVAAVEKGERPLKLAEAESLAAILALDSIEDLVERPAEAITAAALSRMERATDALLDSLTAFWDAQFALANVLDEVSARQGIDETPDVDSRFAKWLRADPVDNVVMAASPYVPLTPEIVGGVHNAEHTSWTALLANGPYGEHSRRWKMEDDGAPSDTA